MVRNQISQMWRLVLLAAVCRATNAEMCPNQCRCSRGRVYCNNRGFTEIPEDIPVGTKVLYLQDNELENSDQMDRTLSRLTQLESLKLYNNKLSRMPRLNSKFLREVHLNKNRINTISSSSLENAPNLSEMILDDNEISNFGLGRAAFSNLRQLRRISLIRNKLTEFPESLSPSLSALYLTQNQISYVSPDSLANLINLEILYLDRNKLNDDSFVRNAFKGLVNLRELELGFNLITKIPSQLSFTLERLHITANQLEYLRKSELSGLHNLRVLDMAYNRLKSVEHGALESLTKLDAADLSGNNWLCDCYLRDLKNYLRIKKVHHGSREMITCSDPKHSNDLLDSIQENQLECPRLSFNVSETNQKIKVFSEPLEDQPPFAQYKLLYREISGSNSSVSESMVVSFSESQPITYTIASSLKSNQLYQVCLYNSYLYRNSMEIPPSSCRQIRTSSENEADSIVATANQKAGNMETIIGLVTGALIVVLTLAIVTLLCWRKRFPMEKKYQSPIVHREVDPRNLITNYPVTTQSTTSTNFQIHPTGKKPEMTMDASKEFDVTLMLRQPEMENYIKSPLPEYRGNRDYDSSSPPGHHFQTLNSDQTLSRQSQDSSRQDEIGVFV